MVSLPTRDGPGPTPGVSRRDALRLMLASTALLVSPRAFARPAGSARLNVHPARPSLSMSPGLTPLGLGTDRDAQLLVPATYSPTVPASLVVALHGAGGSARGPVNALRDQAEKRGFVVLAVESRSTTWDAIRGNYGVDVRFIEQAMQWTFQRCAIDPHRVILEGFSDGATYALGLGLANGDLFGRIVAFSPGFIPETDSAPRGKPEIFISHGFKDQILPKERTSDVIVPRLRKEGYQVHYEEFDGVHTIAPDVLEKSMKWAGLGA
jgi:predicted esterase